jgi:hypothetical protein
MEPEIKRNVIYNNVSLGRYQSRDDTIMYFSKALFTCLLVLFIVILLLLLIRQIAFQQIFALSSTGSPVFGRQTIIDDSDDWLDVWRGKHTEDGSDFTDIEAANYYSDGRVLNATLWLPSFKETPALDKRVNYGMYIDSDLNNQTGINGIDYKVEIQWDNITKTWTRVFEEWSTNGKSRVLSNETNYQKFYGKGGDYVLLQADLADMLSPSRYKVLFYAEEVKGLKWIMDSPKWIYIPPPDFVVLTFPRSVELRAGEQKNVEVQLNSTNGFNPFFHLSATSSAYASQQEEEQHEDVTLTFEFDESRIPSYGVATTPLTVTASGDATISPHTSFIFANFTFPSEEFFIKPIGSSEGTKIESENIIVPYSLAINVNEALTPIDQVSEFWAKLGGLINFLYLIGGAAATWLFTTYIKKRKSKNDINSSSVQRE